jgi:diguanylate cyclase (GGDEF)-like protein
VDDNRDRPDAARDGGRLTPLERLSTVRFIVGGLLTIYTAYQEQFYRPEGRPGLVTAGIALIIFGLVVAVRGRESTSHTVVQNLFAMALIGYTGVLAVSPILAVVSAASLGIVTLSIAVQCSTRQTLFLVALSPIAGVVAISRTGVSGAAFVALSMVVITTTIIPALITLHYRRQLKEALDQLQLQAVTDGLTGLTNRHGMLDMVPLLFAEAERNGRLIAVLMADVDHFKQFNDRLGHLAGDEALRAVAKVIRSTVRQTDIVARFGGEEMCVVAAFDEDDDVHMFAERIRKNVEASDDCGVTLSIGGYTCRPTRDVPYSEQFLSMVGKADEQLYAAKHGGRNAVHLVDA